MNVALPVLDANYIGKVGLFEAVFTLEWHKDGTVSGTYRYPSRPGQSYDLKGENHAEGALNLEEFTNGTRTAKCHLEKITMDKVILWRGEMENVDGRKLPMEFARARK